jgi:hypothetical protein
MLSRVADDRFRRPGFVALLAGAVCLFLRGGLQAQAAASQSELSSELGKAKAALEKYQDPVLAVHDGYFSTLGCVEYPKAGAPGEVPYPAGGMGVHFFNSSLIGQPLDPTRPQVLVYEPSGDKLKLVAAEWFVPLATGVKERPELFGRPFDGPMEGHYPLMPHAMSHYDLHVWLWKPNPAGMFSPTNPALKCPTVGYSFQEKAPNIVAHPK